MNVRGRLLHRLRHGDWRWFARAVRDRLAPVRPSFAEPLATALRDRHGLEIGGPSRLFRPSGGLPAYDWLTRVDNVNFASTTAWESNAAEGGAFHFHPARMPGRQYVREAGDLKGLGDTSYDIVLSSHCLEHLANPLRALREWRRVVRPGGNLLLALPDPRHTFDHRRPVTTLAHLKEDESADRTENDLTHLSEVLALHDLQRDPDAGSPAEFRTRSERNALHRCLHHHVFDLALVRAMLAETGWHVIATETLRPMHLVAWARRDEP